MPDKCVTCTDKSVICHGKSAGNLTDLPPATDRSVVLWPELTDVSYGARPMNLSLTEVATALGKSERQVRHLIKQGKLGAKKESGKWRIRSEDLPLTDSQRSALSSRVDVARAAFDKGVAPAEKAGAADGEPRRYSVTSLRAFKAGEEIYRELEGRLGRDDPAVRQMFSAVALLARGYHSFQPSAKAARYVEAREAAAMALAHLLLEGDAGHTERPQLAHRIEQELIPKIAKLAASHERRAGRARFERFGSTLSAGARHVP